jgi:hypothetical protein
VLVAIDEANVLLEPQLPKGDMYFEPVALDDVGFPRQQHGSCHHSDIFTCRPLPFPLPGWL